MLLTKSNGMIIGPIASLLGMFMNGIFYVLNKIGIPNIGLAIIIMTILIYMAMLPLTVKQQKFSKLQRKMQPELNKINKKYEGRKDPESMERQQAEIKEVYGKYGVSATGSCVQLIIQMPILLALYRVFYNIPAYVPMVKQVFFPLVDELITANAGDYLKETNAARFFLKQFENENYINGVTEYVQNTFIDVLNKFNSADWTALTENFADLKGDIANTVTSLTKYNSFLGLNMANSPSSLFRQAMESKTYVLIIVALIIPVLAAVTQYLNVALMPQPAAQDGNDQMNNTMKSMNVMMPIMSAFFCWSLPNGMGIYWITGAVIRCIQQVVINKQIDKMDIDAMVEKNLEKMKEKEAKEGKKDKNRVSSSTMNTYSSMNTRRMKDKSSTSVSSDSERKAQQARQTNGKKYKSGSLAAKANMVSSFNDADNSSSKKQGRKG
ncbi:MAG: YidC/Oxa1 family membrane protein insertase [Lachnospiraceae bacterium]|nr:YidC/Oxa1 family membrane protein insertase [Lachnospiraceae bacterium]